MSSSLLGNEKFKEFCKTHVVAGVSRKSPEMADLKNEFHLTRGNSQVIVLNAKGETLASVMGDSCGAGCTKESADQFPEKVIEKINSFLAREQTYNAMQKAVIDNPGDARALDAYTKACEESWDWQSLAETYEAVLKSDKLEKSQRARVMYEVLRSKNSTKWQGGNPFSPDKNGPLEKMGFDILLNYPATEGAEKTAELFYSIWFPDFDLAKVVEDGIARFREQAKQSPNPAACEKLVEKIKTTAEQNLKSLRTQLDNMLKQENANPFNIGYYAALLGDAELTVKHLENKNGWHKTLYEKAQARLKEKQASTPK